MAKIVLEMIGLVFDGIRGLLHFEVVLIPFQ
jgi:hypothetical protein